MVLEDRIPLTKFALHHVDRDPENGMYGGSRILTEEYGDLDVTSFDVGQGIVRAQDIWKRHEPLVFKLQPTDGKSDLNFFKEKIVARWQELEPDYVDDENYTDYLPAHYENLADMLALYLLYLFWMRTTRVAIETHTKTKQTTEELVAQYERSVRGTIV